MLYMVQLENHKNSILILLPISSQILNDFCVTPLIVPRRERVTRMLKNNPIAQVCFRNEDVSKLPKNVPNIVSERKE